jgi:hypothetical protein
MWWVDADRQGNRRPFGDATNGPRDDAILSGRRQPCQEACESVDRETMGNEEVTACWRRT